MGHAYTYHGWSEHGRQGRLEGLTVVQSSLLALAGSVVGLTSVAIGLFMLRTGRSMREQNEGVVGTETTAVRDVRPGTVKVRGTASPTDDGRLVEGVTPTGEALVTVFEAEQESGGKGRNYRTVAERRNVVPFDVDDGTGSVRVDPPADGRIDLAVAGETRVGPGEDPPPAVQRFIDAESDLDEASEYDVFGLKMGDRRRYTEGVVAPGDDIVVYGEVSEAGAGWNDQDYVFDGGADPSSFLLSDKSDDQLSGEAQLRGGFGLLLYATGVISVFLGLGLTVVPWVLVA